MYKLNFLKLVSVIMGFVVIVLAGLLAANATAISVPKRSLSAQVTMLSEGVEIFIPENSDGPVPTLIMYHGCGGLKQVQYDYAEAVLEAGYGVMVVDSLSPRGIGSFGAITQVCTAMRLWGQERAADVHATLAIATEDPRIDENRIAMIGWSHGGWTLIEALTYSGERDLPEPLRGQQIHIIEENISNRLQAVILIYPYCSLPIRGNGSHMDLDIPVYSILAGQDLIANHHDCVKTLDRASNAGVPIEYEIWAENTHAFDNPSSNGDPRMEYDADASAIAREHVINILNQTFSD